MRAMWTALIAPGGVAETPPVTADRPFVCGSFPDATGVVHVPGPFRCGGCRPRKVGIAVKRVPSGAKRSVTTRIQRGSADFPVDGRPLHTRASAPRAIEKPPRCSRATGLAPSPRGDCTFLPASPARGRTAPRSHERRPRAPHVEGAIPRRVHRAGPETTGLAPHDRFDAVPQDEATAERTARSNAFNVTGAIPADSDRPLRPVRPHRPTAGCERASLIRRPAHQPASINRLGRCGSGDGGWSAVPQAAQCRRRIPPASTTRDCTLNVGRPRTVQMAGGRTPCHGILRRAKSTIAPR
jgi:hypothetical protein